MNESMRECIQACWDCRHACQMTLFSHCLPIGSVHADADHVRLMNDCIQICQVTADFMTRDSSLHELLCGVCAEVCEACAKSCERIGDEKMEACAKACRTCAASCRTMSRARKAA